MEGETIIQKPVQCVQASSLHILQDKYDALQGIESDPGETGFGCLMVVAPSSGICIDLLVSFTHPS